MTLYLNSSVYIANLPFSQSLNPLHFRAKPSHQCSHPYRRPLAGADCLPTPCFASCCLKEFVMKTWKLFAFALAVAGIMGTEVNAGGRHGRCSGGSCGSAVTTCSGGSCGQAAAAAPAAPSTP